MIFHYRYLFSVLLLQLSNESISEHFASSVIRFSTCFFVIQSAILTILLPEIVSAIFIAKLSQEEECFYGNYFHFDRQAPNHVFPLQVFVLSFVAGNE